MNTYGVIIGVLYIGLVGSSTTKEERPESQKNDQYRRRALSLKKARDREDARVRKALAQPGADPSAATAVPAPVAVTPGPAGQIPQARKDPAKKAPGSSAPLKSIIPGARRFARSLLGHMAAQKKTLLLSPFSLHTALAATTAGAEGATASQLHRALGAGSMGDAYHATMKSLLSRVRTMGGGGVLSMQNRLELSKITLKKSYLDFVKAHYGMTVTAGKAVQPQVDVINEVSFRGTWLYAFPKALTRRRAFYNKGTTKKMVPVMTLKSTFSQAADPLFRALVLPYKGGHFEMLVVLPASRDGLKKVLTAVHGGALDKLHYYKRNLELRFPKMTLAQKVRLVEALKAMGVREAFDSKAARFGKMNHRLFIHDVTQKLKVVVEEKGTSAKAATVVRLRTMSVDRPLQDPRYIEFAVDHPFLFIIRTVTTKLPIFMGVVRTL